MPLSKDHAAGGIAGVSVATMLATVIQGAQGCGPEMAGAEAGLLVLGLGALYSIGSALLARRFGIAPPPVA